jgi:hypothetical protein
MGVVAMQILQPATGATFTGPAAVRLRGEITPVPGVTLFPKWYSSLEAPDPPGSPLPGGTVLDFTTALGTGTHVITFSAKDVLADDKDSLPNVRHAGMAGGPPGPNNPGCVIHVFSAEMVLPNTTVSRAAPALTAVAPLKWGDDDYKAINTIRFVWRFAPFGAPAGRASATLTPALTQLRFEPADPPSKPKPVVVYTGTLPAGLGLGAYDMTLRVEFIANAAVGHEVTRRVTLT